MKSNDFVYYLTKYFKIYMPSVLGLREKSIQSYQTAFFIFFKFMKIEKNIAPDKITFDIFSTELLIEFLQYLEDNDNSISTRNHRLSVLRSFFKYIQLNEPKHILLMQQLLSIKHKKQPKPIVNYFTTKGIKLLLSMPVSTTRYGYRDMLLLSVLYETAARVSELINLTIGDIRIENPATITLHGKGNKSRIVPISKDVALLIKNYLSKEKLITFEHRTKLLFTNHSKNSLTNAGIDYILKKYTTAARIINPSIIPERVSPHCLRHSKAMHLLQAGVNLVYIRDLLGHENLKTTEIYAKTDNLQKRKAIESAYIDLPNDNNFSGDWNENVSLMQWIKNICE